MAGLIQATDGNLYGTTSAGGVDRECNNGNFFGCGTIFKITTGGKLTTLYTFCAEGTCNDGEFPDGGLVQATSGIFYGIGSCRHRVQDTARLLSHRQDRLLACYRKCFAVSGAHNV